MSEGGQDQSNDSLNLKSDAMAAMQNAVGDLIETHENAENAAMAGAAEHEHVSTFVDEIAQALANGLNESVGFFAGAVAEETEYYNKTDLKQQIKDKSEEYRGSDKQPLDEFIQERLEGVTVSKTTDHRQGADYIFDFGTFKVETTSGKDGRGHFRFDVFRNLIHESGGVNTAPPVKDRRGGEEWRDFMVQMIDDRGEERYTRGPRTKAFEALRNRVKRLTGYGTAEGALDHSGVWVVRETYDAPDWFSMGQPFSYDRPGPVDTPDWWASIGARTVAKNPPEWYGNGEIDRLPLGKDRDLPDDTVSEIRVHESLIQSIIDDAEITRSALYHELNARNLTVHGTSGASMTQWVSGSDERFWTLRPDLGTPRTYVPDPNAGVTVSRGTAHVDERDGQDEQDDDRNEHAEPADSGADDARDDSGGFDSVGDTA